MKRILYLSHIRWGWIKQRPQFLAEGLAKDNQVDYYFYQGRSHKSSDDYTSLKINEDLHLTLHTYRRIPFTAIPIIGKWKLFDWINRCFIRWQLPDFKQYDLIWITSPFLYPLVKSARDNSFIVYDCMDDMAEFPDIKCNKNKVKNVIDAERDLLTRSRSIVFCSSNYLAKTITGRAGVRKNLSVINNAIELPQRKSLIPDHDLPQDIKAKLDFVSNLSNVFMYIGTISEWVDFEKLERLTKEISDLNIVLIGPIGGTTIPDKSRIHVIGPINRDYIFVFMEKAKALIMPFVVNELIESVNPVKLYEYIYSGKPSVAPYYSESKLFADYVHLYKDYNELKQLSLAIIEDKVEMPDEEKRNSFILLNCWDSRVAAIEKTLSYLLRSDSCKSLCGRSYEDI